MLVGIGGSALGPQLVDQALARPGQGLSFYSFDNTDPDGMERELARIPALDRTLCVIISKSGGTRETLNGQLIAQRVLESRGIPFAKHAVAVTGAGSKLDQIATRDGWLERFPMWDWVGGRTSELSAVGLLPAALQGIAIDDLLRGAQLMDRATRIPRTRDNPAALLALMWWHAGKGRGEKAMVVLPYRDRLKPLSNYLQQLVMESLGKAKSLSGELVHQGLTVLGNKGSTDQHAFVQEVVERPAKYFVNFVEVQSDTDSVQHALGIAQMPVADGVVAGDYLSGFFQGTRAALVQNGGESLTLTLRELSALTLGGLIALYERAVGLYAQLIQVNAYHQPGVEAGKLAAEKVLSIQGLVLKHLAGASRSLSVAELAQQPGLVGEEMVIFKVLQHLAVNHRVKTEPSKNIFDFRYSSL